MAAAGVGDGSWLRRVALPVGLAALEAAWMYPWSLLLGLWLRPGGGAPLLPAPSIFALLLLGRAATRGARRLGWPLGLARAALVALGLLAVAVAVVLVHGVGVLDAAARAALARTLPDVLLVNPQPPVFAAALGSFLWWRGTVRGRGELGFDDLEGAFRQGVLGLVAFLAAAAASESASYQAVEGEAAPYVLGFFFAGLVSLALARLAAVREQSQARQGRAPAFSREWLAVLLGVVGGLLLVALLFAQLVTFDLIAAIWRPIGGPLGTAASWLLLAILLPIALLIELIVYVARLLLHPGEPPPRPPQDDLAGQLQRLVRGQEASGLPAGVAEAARWGAVALIAAVVLATLARAVYWFVDAERDDEVEEERDSVWSWASLRHALGAWLRSLYGRWFRRPRAATAPLTAASDAAVAPPPMVATVRAIYRELLALGRLAGSPRSPTATPYEHLPRLQAALDPDEDLAGITEAYVQARYGAEPPSDARVRDVRARWERVVAHARPPPDAEGPGDEPSAPERKPT